MRLHRELDAKKGDYSQERKSAGRPRVRREVVKLVVRFARENPPWGYDRIQEALANHGYHISDDAGDNAVWSV